MPPCLKHRGLGMQNSSHDMGSNNVSMQICMNTDIRLGKLKNNVVYIYISIIYNYISIKTCYHTWMVYT